MNNVNEPAPVEPTNNEPVEPSVEPTVEPTEETPEQKIERLEKKLGETLAQKDHWKGKATAEPSEPAPASEPEPTSKKVELSQTDILAIARSDVHEEDFERLTKFAEMEGLTVKEALAHDDMQAILERRAESRKAAEASNTDGAKPTQSAVTGDTLLEQAKSGKMPDAKDLQAMWDAETGK